MTCIERRREIRFGRYDDVHALSQRIGGIVQVLFSRLSWHECVLFRILDRDGIKHIIVTPGILGVIVINIWGILVGGGAGIERAGARSNRLSTRFDVGLDV